MKQEQFETLHAQEWDDFAAWLAWHEKSRRQRESEWPPRPAHEMPQRYRHVCQHLAIARERGYSLSLIERLHALARDGHQLIYSTEASLAQRALDYASGGFARDVRANRWWVLASALLLFGPQLMMMLAVHLKPDLAYLIIPQHQILRFEEMYSGEAHDLGRVARDAATDVQMFGFYIFNNVSIAFRCFAGGITAGLLTVTALVFNGLSFGVVEMRLIQAGLGSNFHSFVIGHGGFELGAIVLSGAAGLRLGFAVLAPGQRSRGAALRHTARALVGMVCGLAVMLFIAALIEAFWSPLKLSLAIKFGVGGVLCVLPLLYFLLAGRQHGA